MRTAALAFVGMLLAVLVGLWLFQQFNGGKTPLERSTEDLDRASALLREDFAHASNSLRVAVAEYYANTGKLPEKNSDMGLPEPAEYRGRTLRSATVRAGGSIDLVFDVNSGKEGGHVLLLPNMEHAPAMGVQWRCETSDYPQIKRALPSCDYRKH